MRDRPHRLNVDECDHNTSTARHEEKERFARDQAFALSDRAPRDLSSSARTVLLTKSLWEIRYDPNTVLHSVIMRRAGETFFFALAGFACILCYINNVKYIFGPSTKSARVPQKKQKTSENTEGARENADKWLTQLCLTNMKCFIYDIVKMWHGIAHIKQNEKFSKLVQIKRLYP